MKGAVCGLKGRFLLCTLLLQLAAAFRSATAQTATASSSSQLAAALADGSVKEIVVLADIATAQILTVSSSVIVRGDRQQPRRVLTSTSGGAASSAAIINAGTISILRCSFLRMSNTNAGDTGAAALYNTGTAVLDTSEFLGNSADAPAIGGVVVNEGRINVTGCNFQRNSASAGGALWNGKGRLSIRTSEFTDNTALLDASGAIVTNSAGTLIIDSSNFTNNINSAIQTAGSLFLSASHFEGNTQAPFGSGVYVLKGSATIQGCTFTGNEVSASGGVGGAVYASGNSLDLSGSQFTRNFAPFGGGALLLAAGTASVAACTFHQNNALQGGAIQNDNTMVLTDCIFTENTASNVGGAFVGQFSSTIVRCTFDSNTCNGNPINTGGALYINELGANITDTTFRRNQSPGGGAIYFISSTCNINNATFVDNAAVTGGALMAISGNNVVVAASNFTTNNASLDGGAVYSEGDITLRDTTLSRNVAGRFGGAIFSAGTAVLRVVRNRLVQNTAPRGGGIANQAVAALTNCTFFQDSASVSGGALWISAGTYSDLGVVTLQNQIGASERTVTCTGCNFTEATAQDGGGMFLGGAGTQVAAICKAWETTTITGSTFNSNNASESGGAINIDGRYCDSAANITISDSAFEFNRAQSGGGVYAACGPTGVCATFDSSDFRDNTAVGGGGGAILSTLTPNITCSGQRSAAGCSEWTGNLAINGYGPTLATDPAEFQPAADNYSAQPSTRPLSNLTLTIIDALGQVVSAGNKSQLVFYAEYTNSSGRLDGQTFTAAQQGVANFSNVAIVSVPGVRSLQLRAFDYPILPPVGISVTIRPCLLGEVRNDDNTLCTYCEQPLFSWNPTNFSCEVCPDGADCLGGSVVVPVDGYWHSAERSFQFHQCPNNDACSYHNRSVVLEGLVRNGSWEQVQQCSDGDGWESSGGTSNFQCKKCSSKVVNALAYTGITLITFVAIVLITRAALTTELDDTPDEHGRIPLGQAVQAMCKVIVTYIQVTSIAFGVSFNFPGFVNTAVTVLSSTSSLGSGIISSYCLMNNSGTLNKYYQLVLIYALLPIAGILAPAGIWLLVYWFAKFRFRHRANPPELRKYIRGFVVTFMVVEFFLWPAVTQQLISLFACRKIDSLGVPYDANERAVGTYWDQYINDKCYTGTHLTMVLAVGIPGIILFGLGLPIGAYLMLWQRRMKLESEHTVKYYGFLYTGYKRSAFFWEFIVTLEKLVLILIAVFLGVLGTQQQVLIALAVAAMCMALNVHAVPYSSPKLNNMQTLAWSGNCLLLYIAWLLFLPLTSVTSTLLSIAFAVSYFGTVIMFLALMFSEVYLAYQKKKRGLDDDQVEDSDLGEALQEAFGPVLGTILLTAKVAYTLGKNTVTKMQWLGHKVSSRLSHDSHNSATASANNMHTATSSLAKASTRTLSTHAEESEYPAADLHTDR
eukprot:jgi/Chlat1/2950/Chrsp2S04680